MSNICLKIDNKEVVNSMSRISLYLLLLAWGVSVFVASYFMKYYHLTGKPIASSEDSRDYSASRRNAGREYRAKRFEQRNNKKAISVENIDDMQVRDIYENYDYLVSAYRQKLLALGCKDWDIAQLDAYEEQFRGVEQKRFHQQIFYEAMVLENFGLLAKSMGKISRSLNDQSFLANALWAQRKHFCLLDENSLKSLDSNYPQLRRYLLEGAYDNSRTTGDLMDYMRILELSGKGELKSDMVSKAADNLLGSASFWEGDAGYDASLKELEATAAHSVDPLGMAIRATLIGRDPFEHWKYIEELENQKDIEQYIGTVAEHFAVGALSIDPGEAIQRLSSLGLEQKYKDQLIAKTMERWMIAEPMAASEGAGNALQGEDLKAASREIVKYLESKGLQDQSAPWKELLSN